MRKTFNPENRYTISLNDGKYINFLNTKGLDSTGLSFKSLYIKDDRLEIETEDGKYVFISENSNGIWKYDIWQEITDILTFYVDQYVMIHAIEKDGKVYIIPHNPLLKPITLTDAFIEGDDEKIIKGYFTINTRKFIIQLENFKISNVIC